MSRAAEGSLKALGLERHQALIVSHRDGQPHVHVIANRGGAGERQGGGVEPEQAKTLEVGGRIRAGAGEDPVPAAGEEQQAAGGGGSGSWMGAGIREAASGGSG